MIHEILDELRTDFQWAMQNSRVLFPDEASVCQESFGDFEQSRTEYDTQSPRESVLLESKSLPEMPEPSTLFSPNSTWPD